MENIKVIEEKNGELKIFFDQEYTKRLQKLFNERSNKKIITLENFLIKILKKSLKKFDNCLICDSCSKEIDFNENISKIKKEIKKSQLKIVCFRCYKLFIKATRLHL